MIVKFKKSIELEEDYELDFEEGCVVSHSTALMHSTTYRIIIKKDDFIVVDKFKWNPIYGDIEERDVETYSIEDFIKKFEPISDFIKYYGFPRPRPMRFYVGPVRRNIFQKFWLTLRGFLQFSILKNSNPNKR